MYVLPRRGQAKEDGKVTVYILGRIRRPVRKHAQLFRPYRCDQSRRQESTSQSAQDSEPQIFDLSCQSADASLP